MSSHDETTPLHQRYRPATVQTNSDAMSLHKFGGAKSGGYVVSSDHRANSSCVSTHV